MRAAITVCLISVIFILFTAFSCDENYTTQEIEPTPAPVKGEYVAEAGTETGNIYEIK